MTGAVIFIVALLTLASVMLAGLYLMVRDAPQQAPQQSRRHRPWNFK